MVVEKVVSAGNPALEPGYFCVAVSEDLFQLLTPHLALPWRMFSKFNHGLVVFSALMYIIYLIVKYQTCKPNQIFWIKEW